MTIGERIKDLRKKNDLTQEKLADYLCVSYQAVSKWECGSSNPDISLIGPLTKLLHVSADELLGLVNGEEAKRREQLEAQYESTYRTGSIAMRYEVACTAVSEYPGEMKYLDWLAWCEAMRSFDYADDDKYIAEQEKAIKHFACVIENAQDEKVKASSIQGIVQYLCLRGRHDEAKKYAELYPDNYSISKDIILLDCLHGEEKIWHYQKMLDRMMWDILDHIGKDVGNCKMLAYDAQEKILNILIPDHNYQYYNCMLSKNYRRKAVLYYADGKNEDAILYLKKALEYASAYDKLVNENKTYRYTSPFFDRIEFNTEDICITGTTSEVEDVYEFIKHHDFSSLRDRDDFKALFSN